MLHERHIFKFQRAYNMSEVDLLGATKATVIWKKKHTYYRKYVEKYL